MGCLLCRAQGSSQAAAACGSEGELRVACRSAQAGWPHERRWVETQCFLCAQAFCTGCAESGTVSGRCLEPLPGWALPAGIHLQLQQQWDVWFIVASMALVFADAQLVTQSPHREADQRLQAANEAAKERNRAAQARERAARGEQRQARALRAGALVWLNPTPLNRRFLELVAAELGDIVQP